MAPSIALEVHTLQESVLNGHTAWNGAVVGYNGMHVEGWIALHVNPIGSETSIKAIIQELFNKAGVRTRSQLFRIAIEKYSSDWLGSEQ